MTAKPAGDTAMIILPVADYVADSDVAFFPACQQTQQAAPFSANAESSSAWLGPPQTASGNGLFCPILPRNAQIHAQNCFGSILYLLVSMVCKVPDLALTELRLY